MTNTPSTEPCPDSIIRDLHRIREAIVESFGGDLHALTDDARERQAQSGRVIWRGKVPSPTIQRSGGGAASIPGESAPAG